MLSIFGYSSITVFICSVCIAGGVHHSYNAIRGPFCFAYPRGNFAWGNEWHQGLPPHRFPAAQQPRGERASWSKLTHGC